MFERASPVGFGYSLFCAAGLLFLGCSSATDAIDTGPPEPALDTDARRKGNETSEAPGTAAEGGEEAPPFSRPIPPRTSLYWLLVGSLDENRAEKVFDIDIFDAAPAGSYLQQPNGTRINLPTGANAGAVQRLKAKGKTVICYFDTGAWEAYRPDAHLFPKAVIGANTGWEEENWLDIRRSSWSKFEGIILARMDLAVRMGCDGVEGDQNNPLGNSPGFPITLADEAAWYDEMAAQLHSRRLIAIMKNGVEVLLDGAYGPRAVSSYDGALNEECNQYDECEVYDPFIKARKVVWNVEYETPPSAFCSKDNARDIDGYFSHNPPNATTWIACR